MRGFVPYFFLAPRYNLLNYLKAEFVLNASLVNPFNSSHFFWIDGGYGHGLPNIWPPHKGKRWPDPDKVRIRILASAFFFFLLLAILTEVVFALTAQLLFCRFYAGFLPTHL